MLWAGEVLGGRQKGAYGVVGARQLGAKEV